MRTVRLLILMIFTGLWSADARAQTLHIPLINVGELETARVSVPAGYTELSIDEIRVAGSARGNPGLRILDESYHSLSDRLVDVRVGRITGSPANGASRFELSFEQIRVGRLVIDPGPGDPLLVNLKFGNDASAANVALTGGRYDEIKVYLDRNWPEVDEARRAAIVRFSGVRFRTVALEGRSAFVPITLELEGQPTIPDAGDGRNALSLARLQILSGRVNLYRPERPVGTVEPATAEICGRDERRLLFTLRDARIGAVDDASLLTGDERSRLAVAASYRPCMEIILTEVTTGGTLSIQNSEGIVGSLVIDGLSSGSRRGDVFELKSLAVSSLRMIRASVDHLSIDTENQGSIGNPTLAVWGTLDISGTIRMPSQIYSSLDETLQAQGLDQAQDLSGIRTFLVNTLWRSFTIDPNGPAASRALYIVLKNDSRSIYGPLITFVTDWFTGFGIQLIKPLVTAFGYLILPFLITLVCVKSARTWSFFREYWQRLILNRPGTPGLIPPYLEGIMGPQRVLLLLQIALISLFIQNTVLVGQ
jgi:hypothetical protein